MNNYAKLLQCLQNSGLVVRFHQSLQNMLHKYIHEKKERLFGHLLICLQHFKTLMNLQKYIPFEILFGAKAILPLDLEAGVYLVQ